MRFDPALVGLVLSALSTGVVIVGALAALRQLRYLRQGNELETLEGLYAQWNTDEMRGDREFAIHEVPRLIDDPSFHTELERIPVGPRAERVVHVLNMLERVSAYWHAGALSEDLTTIMWAHAAADHWRSARDAVWIMRGERGVRVYEHLEDFAMRVPQLQEHVARRKRKLRRDPVLERRSGDSASTRESGAVTTTAVN